MNLQTVITNLRNTIAGKEEHLANLRYQSTLMTPSDEFTTKATIRLLKINIDELKRILQDVEQCLPDEFAHMRNSLQD